MALFKSQVFTQASGSIGGQTYSHNRGGLYIRSRTVPVDPLTSRQATVRQLMGDLSNAWVNTLTTIQRAAWDFYAVQVPLPGPTGDPRNVGGLGMYVRSNLPRLQAALARVDAAPTTFDLGPPPLFTAISLESTANSGDFTWSGTAEWDIAGSTVLVFLGRGRNPSVNYYRGPFRLWATILSTATPPVTLTLPPYVITDGLRYTLHMRATNPDGRLSQSVFVEETATT